MARAALHLPTGAGTVPPDMLESVRASFEYSVDLTEPLIGLCDLDVAVLDAPESAIPAWGVGGYTYGPHVVLLALHPAMEGTQQRLVATLVHEFHHVMRWLGPGWGSSLRERLVSEGLAMLFEEEVLGEPSEFATQTIEAEHIGLAIQHLDEEPADEQRWFFPGRDVPLWFGYTLGYRWAKDYATESSSSAARLVTVAATEVIAT